MLLTKNIEKLKYSEKVDITCDYCGTLHKRAKRDVVKQEKHYCNNVCQNSFQRKELVLVYNTRTTKICNRCDKELPLSNFCKKVSSLDGLQGFCKVCNSERSKTYYKNNHEKHKRVIKDRGHKQKQLIREFLLNLLKNSECKDCQNNDIRVLEFDHLPGFEKKHNVSEMITGRYSVLRVQEEINKCEIVCANCHKIRTIDRADKHYKKGFVPLIK